MNSPKVSILCTTYNHVNYISDCIDGFLFQNTSFEYEILIFDDASSDGTADLVKKYAKKDSRIITFLQSENQWSKKKYGLYDWLLPAAKGEYVALCEGDDYWTDPLKLQKQVDYLEKNQIDFCMSKYKILLRGKLIIPKDSKEVGVNGVYNYEDYLTQRFSHTSTFMFNSNLVNYEFINSINLNKIFGGDQLLLYLIYLVKPSFKIGYLNEFLTVYRIFSDNITNSTNPLNVLNSRLHFYESILKNSPELSHIVTLKIESTVNEIKTAEKYFFLKRNIWIIKRKIKKLIGY